MVGRHLPSPVSTRTTQFSKNPRKTGAKFQAIARAVAMISHSSTSTVSAAHAHRRRSQAGHEYLNTPLSPVTEPLTGRSTE
jgi:hypothetical protein